MSFQGYNRLLLVHMNPCSGIFGLGFGPIWQDESCSEFIQGCCIDCLRDANTTLTLHKQPLMQTFNHSTKGPDRYHFRSKHLTYITYLCTTLFLFWFSVLMYSMQNYCKYLDYNLTSFWSLLN